MRLASKKPERKPKEGNQGKVGQGGGGKGEEAKQREVREKAAREVAPPNLRSSRTGRPTHADHPSNQGAGSSAISGTTSPVPLLSTGLIEAHQSGQPAGARVRRPLAERQFRLIPGPCNHDHRPQSLYSVFDSAMPCAVGHATRASGNSTFDRRRDNRRCRT
jgi:hypothetical protein